jgi:hypothetical protein
MKKRRKKNLSIGLNVNRTVMKVGGGEFIIDII